MVRTCSVFIEKHNTEVHWKIFFHCTCVKGIGLKSMNFYSSNESGCQLADTLEGKESHGFFADYLVASDSQYRTMLN